MEEKWSFFGDLPVETETIIIRSNPNFQPPRVFEMWRYPWPSWAYFRVWCKMVAYKVWFQYIRGQNVYVFREVWKNFIFTKKSENPVGRGGGNSPEEFLK